MAAISKEAFDEISTPELTCIKLLHPTTDSCFKALIDLLLHTFNGSSKFFLVIYLLQSIISWKKLNKHFVKKQVYAYCRSIMYAVCYATLFSTSTCLMRKYIHQYYFHTLALCGACGGLAIFVESKENRSLNTAIYTNLVVETIFRYVYWKNILPRTALKETFMFMTCSAALMYLLRLQKTENKTTKLWFYYPSRIKANHQEETLCTHPTSCYNYIYQGFGTYFLIGYLLQLLKYVLPRLNQIIFSPLQILKAILCKNKFLFGLFLGGYVAIYRMASCLLRKRDKEEKPFHSLLAGFLAGSAYLFKPTLSIAAIAITTTLQLTMEQLVCLNDLQSEFPAKETAFVLCSGFLFHNRFFLPDSCPKYMKTVLNTVTNGQVNELYERALQLFGPILTKYTLS